MFYGYGGGSVDVGGVVVVVVVVGGVTALPPFRTCPLISPAGFLAVCTFTYASPPRSAVTVRPFTLADPRAPERHGPHSGTATGPALPGLARWTCAASALPVRPRNLSCQASVPRLPCRTRPAAKLPLALAFTPCGLGTSFAVPSAAVNAIAFASAPSQPALPIPAHKPAANTAAVTAPTPSFRRFTSAPRSDRLTTVFATRLPIGLLCGRGNWEGLAERASSQGCRWSSRGKDAGSVHISGYGRDRGRRLAAIQRSPGGTEPVSPSPPRPRDLRCARRGPASLRSRCRRGRSARVHAR
jgi:hypothetical protein